MSDQLLLWVTPLGEIAGTSLVPAGRTPHRSSSSSLYAHINALSASANLDRHCFVPRALCALADAEHFTISEGEVDGNIVQFTQTYDDGDQTRWRAVVKEDAHGVVSMVHGTWSGHIEGRFDARRSSDRREAEQRSGGSTQAPRQVVVTTSSRAAGGGQKVAELQLTLSSLEHRLQQQTEHVQDLQEQRAQVEAELHLEVSTAPLRPRACAARCVRKCVYYNRKRLCVCVCSGRITAARRMLWRIYGSGLSVSPPAATATSTPRRASTT